MADKKSEDATQPLSDNDDTTQNIGVERTEPLENADDATDPFFDGEQATEPAGFADDATRALTGGDSESTVVAGTGGAPSPLAAMQPGYMLKQRFLLEEKLGEGGMGAVFRAVDQRKVETRHHNPHIAIKLITGDFSRDPRAFIALQRETDKSQTLAHPNIITVYDFDRDGDVFFMTMENLVGYTLNEYIRSEEKTPEKSLRFIEEITNGIAYAHLRNIVHSDLKPPNIFVTEDGKIKVLDFGIARAFSAMGSAAPVDDAGEIVGLTPAYASCEMFEGQDPHPADDVYAIGLLAYELLTGSHPFGRKKAVDAREEGLKPKRIKGLRGYQWDAIAKALAFDRADRWQDAEQFRRKFTGSGRRVKQLSTALAVVLLSFGAYTLLYEPEAGPDIPFEQLPPLAQQRFLENLGEGRQALSFGDLNGALFYFDRAHEIHPRNREVVRELNNLLDRILAEMPADAAPDELRRQHFLVGELLKYDSLSHNAKLIAREKALAKQIDD